MGIIRNIPKYIDVAPVLKEFCLSQGVFFGQKTPTYGSVFHNTEIALNRNNIYRRPGKHRSSGQLVYANLKFIYTSLDLEVPKEEFNIKNKGDRFLDSYKWRALRMQAIIKYGSICQCCGNTPANGIVINVDHIKPRKTHPELALEISNLQILCNACNHGKGNWDQTDWR